MEDVASPAMRIALALLAVALAAILPSSAFATDYPAKDSRYHSYPEMVRHIEQVAATHPDIVRVFSIGKSHQGRALWAAEVSDQPGRDEGEPEILFDGLHHAREHLSAEMPIYILDLLTRQYGKPTDLGKRVTKLVDKRRTWIVFMVNPDGLQHDLTGSPYRSWRKNRQPTPGTSRLGTDLNRNYGYRFGCCGGSSGAPGAFDYRGPSAWSAPAIWACRLASMSAASDGSSRSTRRRERVTWPARHSRSRPTASDLPI